MIKWLGALLPAAAGIKPPELALVWFSLAQDFERTALKPVALPDGNLRLLSVQDLRLRAGGLFRIGVEPSTLLGGEALRRAARMPPRTWKRLREVGLEQGADPTQWLGHVGEVSIQGLRTETMNDSGTWVATG